MVASEWTGFSPRSAGQSSEARPLTGLRPREASVCPSFLHCEQGTRPLPHPAPVRGGSCESWGQFIGPSTQWVREGPQCCAPRPCAPSFPSPHSPPFSFPFFSLWDWGLTPGSVLWGQSCLLGIWAGVKPSGLALLSSQQPGQPRALGPPFHRNSHDRCGAEDLSHGD